jgi:protein-arginine kinase activator protein McsA
MNKCPISGKVCLKFKAFSVTNLNKDKVDSMAICEDCLHKIDEKNIIQNTADEKEKSPESAICCKNCGLSLEDLLNKSKLGCKECYDFFEKPLIIAFEKLQRVPTRENKELKHTGTVPYLWKKEQASQVEPKKFLLELKQKMALSIKEENFKLSAELKKIIAGFESLLKKLDEFKNDSDQYELIRNQISEFILLFREKESEK